MTDWATIAVRFALYADLMILFGLPLFGLYGLGRATAPALPFRRLVAPTAAIGILLSVAALLLLVSSMSGMPVSEVDRTSIEMLLSGTAMGAAWQIRIAALALALLLALAGWRGRLTLGGMAFAAAIALATLAWTGHGAASEGALGWLHLGADIIHLLASAAWVGALAALLLMLLRPAAVMSPDHLTMSHRALAGFATAGTIMVALIILSGIVNGWILVGPDHIGALFTSLYGQLLLAKLMLFAAMLALAAANRFRLTPTLKLALECGGRAAAASALRRSLALETGSAMLILLLVAWLGTLAPPASIS